LRERIGRAHWLGFHYEEHELAAVAGLKRPADKYRDKVFRKAKAALPASVFCAELGWVFTREEFRRRGISHRLLKRLLKKAGHKNLFATTRANNHSMQRLLESLGFQRAGRPFQGLPEEPLLELWVLCPSAGHLGRRVTETDWR
jgi:GNAT superfamily N-acetyltransferase